MPLAVGARMTGMPPVVRALREIGIEVDDLKDAFSEIARQGAALAARYAPKLKGTLADDVRGNRAYSKAVITAGRISVPYAGPINYGWAKRGIEASLFMQQADEALQPYAIQRLEADINDAIRRRGMS